MNFENQYLQNLAMLLENGRKKTDRTGTGTRSLFGMTMRHDLSKGFPLLTTKKVHFKGVRGELLWFVNGCAGGIKGLREKYGVTIWDEWINLENKGKQLPYANMTRWGRENINQLQNVINEIQTTPDSRRLLVLNWNPKQVHHYKNLVLPACHYAFQFEVFDGKLSCMFNMRSVDFLLGAPFNMASYALLTHMVAQVCSLEVGDLVFSGADVHLYNNHIEQAKTQLKREPFELPTLLLNPDIKNIFDFTFEDINIENYTAHPAIKAPVAV